MARASGKKSDIRKRTPLEQAIAEQTDRRARHEAKKLREGYTKTSFWVRTDRLDEVKSFVRSINEQAS